MQKIRYPVESDTTLRQLICKGCSRGRDKERDPSITRQLCLPEIGLVQSECCDLITRWTYKVTGIFQPANEADGERSMYDVRCIPLGSGACLKQIAALHFLLLARGSFKGTMIQSSFHSGFADHIEPAAINPLAHSRLATHLAVAAIIGKVAGVEIRGSGESSGSDPIPIVP